MSESQINGVPANGSFSSARLRDTNPNLYRSLTTIAVGHIALALNFLLTTPTFEPYNIPKNVTGAGFLAIGLGLLVFLNVRRNLKAVRLLLIASIVYTLIWGFGTTESAFAGESSFQLFVVYCVLAGLQFPLLMEPFFNPVTANGKVEE